MQVLHELKNMLLGQVNEVVKKGDISYSELECMDKAVDIIKDIETIFAMADEGYSERMSRENYSGARRRDARGRFTSRNSYDYSGHDLKTKLQNMMREASTEEEKQQIQRFMQEI